MEVSEKPAPINNSDLVEEFRREGGHIVHYRGNRHSNNLRGVTFAYKLNNGRIEFSTAVQHKNDTFTKKIGTKTAIEHFREGKTIILPCRSEPNRWKFQAIATEFLV